MTTPSIAPLIPSFGPTGPRVPGWLPFLGLFALALAFVPASALSGTVRAGAAALRQICKNQAGSVQQLAAILNSMNSGIQCLGLALDDGKVMALRLESHHPVIAAGAPRGAAHVEVAEFPVTEVASRHGAVLAGKPGHDAVIVQGRISSISGTADLVTRYLYNGFTGEYRSCAVRLDRGADTIWRLVNRFNEQVSLIIVETRRLPMLGVIGIANLEGACTETRP